MRGSRFGLKSIAVFEGGKGVLVLAAGLGLLHLVHYHAQYVGEDIVTFLHLNPEGHYPGIFLDLMDRTSNRQLQWLAAGALAYAAVRLTEAYGLWHDRPWAEWFAIISGALYVPAEVYSVIRHPTLPRLGVLIANVVIVVFLAVLCDQRRRAHHHAGEIS